MHRRLLPLLATLLAGQILYAQYVITGTIKDQQTKAVLSGASVKLRSNSDSTFARNVLSDSAGRFAFHDLRADSFLLSVSFVGYGDVVRNIGLDSSSVTLDSAGIGTVAVAVALVQGAGKDLATVVIAAKVPPASQKGDTLEVNASQFKVNPDATAEDLAKKVPGITILNGQVTAHGENVQKVTIDGRELFGDDATAALRNLPAEIIDKIQIFDRLSDQAQLTGIEDGNTTKGINIVTKAAMRNGQYGRVFAGYGTNQRYLAGGNSTILKGNQRISLVGNFNNVNQQNFSQLDLLGVSSGGGNRGGGGRGGGGGGQGGGNFGGGNFGGGNFGGGNNFIVSQQNGINRTSAFGINYSNYLGSKITLTGSYFFNEQKNTTSQIANTQYFNSKIANIVDTTNTTSTNVNNRVNLRFEYRIDSSNLLMITPNLGFQSSNANSSIGTGTSFIPGTATTQTLNTNINNSNRSGDNLSNSILFRHSFKKRGRMFFINLTTAYNQRQGDAYVSTFQRSYTSANFNDTASNRYTNQDNHTTQISTNLTYAEPLGTNSQLQFTYSPSISKSSSNQKTYALNKNNNDYTDFLSNFSNVLDNKTTVQSAGLSYRWGVRDRMLSFGANYQHTALNSTQTYPREVNVNKGFDNVLPNAMFRYKFTTRSSLRIFYRANVITPSVTQLQSVLDPTNAPVYTIGNINLNQQYTHIGSAQYTYTNVSKGLVVVGNLYYQAANNYIATETYTPTRDTLVSGTLLKVGSRLTKPVNLDGYSNLRSLVTFAIPVSFLKSNFNLHGGITYSKIPGITNDVYNMTRNTVYTAGSVISSNVSQHVDFTVSYTANFNKVRNEVRPASNSNYFQQLASVTLNLLSKNGWLFQTDLTNQLYSGLTAGFNQRFTLWNMSAGKKIFKNQKGEIKLTVFDLLNQNQSITRNVTADYIQDVQSVVLRQYAMLNFTYNLRSFGKGNARPANQERRGFGDGFGGPPRF